MTKYPQMHIHLKAGAHFHNMIGHNIDLAIRIGTLPDSSLKARLLTKSRVCVFGSPQYLKKHGTPQHPDDLTDHQCLRYENSPTGHLWEFTVDAQLYPITVNSPLVLNNSDTLVSAAEEHMGLIMLPEYILNKDKENGTLVPVLETYCKVEIPIYLVYPNVSHVCVRTRALMDFLINAFEHANTI
jgi:DNA-binding transcriptional LysR family regulator